MTTLIERARAYLSVANPRDYDEEGDDTCELQGWPDADVQQWLDGSSREVLALTAAHQTGLPNSVLSDEIRSAAPRSVLQDWVMALTTRQQGVLILALRGPDGSPKESAAKPIVRTLRALVMVSGRERKPMDFGQAWRDDTFMNTVHICRDGSWALVEDEFFAEMDAFNLHFFQHLIHAFAVVGLHFPVADVRRRCWLFYVNACHKLHVHPESRDEILHRLRDGVREEDQ